MKKYILTGFAIMVSITTALFLNVNASAQTYTNYWQPFIDNDLVFEITITNVELEEEETFEIEYGTAIVSGNILDFTTFVRDEIDNAINNYWGQNSYSYSVDFYTIVPNDRKQLTNAGFQTRYSRNENLDPSIGVPRLQIYGSKPVIKLVDARLNSSSTFVNSSIYPILEQQNITSLFLINILYIDSTGWESGISSIEYKTVGGGDPYYTNIINQLNNRISELEKQLAKTGADKTQLENNLRVLKQQYEKILEDYEEALNGEISLPKLILTYIDIPIKTLAGFLGFEVFGTNLFEALTGIITMLAILWIIKKIL